MRASILFGCLAIRLALSVSIARADTYSKAPDAYYPPSHCFHVDGPTTYYSEEELVVKNDKNYWHKYKQPHTGHRTICGIPSAHCWYEKGISGAETLKVIPAVVRHLGAKCDRVTAASAIPVNPLIDGQPQ